VQLLPFLVQLPLPHAGGGRPARHGRLLPLRHGDVGRDDLFGGVGGGLPVRFEVRGLGANLARTRLDLGNLRAVALLL